jgi:hypothetical protein
MDTRDLLRLAKQAHNESDPVAQLLTLRQIEEAATEVRRDTLTRAVEIHGKAAVARRLGVSRQAVHLQVQAATREHAR